MWEEKEVCVKLKAVHRSFIHMEVGLVSGARWALTAVYASPQTSIQQFFWEKLNALEVKLPWALIGDFNYVEGGQEVFELESIKQIQGLG